SRRELMSADTYVAEHHTSGAVLQRKRPGNEHVVCGIDRGLTVELDHETLSVRRNLVPIPLVASVDLHLRLGHVDDRAGSVRRVGALIENIHLVARRRADLAWVGATNEDTAVG